LKTGSERVKVNEEVADTQDSLCINVDMIDSFSKKFS